MPGDFNIAQLCLKIPGRLETAVEDLGTVATQLDELRKLATAKGYADILEILDKPVPYDRGY